VGRIAIDAKELREALGHHIRLQRIVFGRDPDRRQAPVPVAVRGVLSIGQIRRQPMTISEDPRGIRLDGS
jgi:hypothetical protein